MLSNIKDTVHIFEVHQKVSPVIVVVIGVVVVVVVMVGGGGAVTEVEVEEMVEEEERDTSAVGRQRTVIIISSCTHKLYTGTPGGLVSGSEDSLVGVMVVVVEEAEGAVETEGLEVGRTVEDEEEGEGVADSAAAGINKGE